MFVKIIKSYRDTVAICDSDLIGKTFEEGNFQINVKESFFKGEKMSEEEILEIIKKMSVEDATFNIVGERAISIALRSGIISEEGIRKIQGIPVGLVLM